MPFGLLRHVLSNLAKRCGAAVSVSGIGFCPCLIGLLPCRGLHAQTLRSGVTLVPVDVRVVDSRGDPVRDLTRADFEVFENDVRQDVAFFETASFDGIGKASAALESDRVFQGAVPYRTFILLLGRGRLNHPAKGMDGLINFVGGSLLPTDRVSVVAYLRVSEPTVDHASVLRFLNHYRDRHESVESQIDSHFATHAGLDLSVRTRNAIAEIFSPPGIPSFRELPGAAGSAAIRYSDWNYVRWAIADAQRLPGEKHLVIVSQDPLGVGQIIEKRSDHVLVRWAASARVAISYIHTGGLDGSPMDRGRISVGSAGDSVTRDALLRHPGTHRMLAELTGGVSSYYSYASKPLDELERSSRFTYVLGYYPKGDVPPDLHRRIEVRVRRSRVTALYRHTYQREPRSTDSADFRQAATDDRIDTALTRVTEPRRPLVTGQFPRIATTLKVSAELRSGTADLVVNIAIDSSRLAFSERDGKHRATVYVVLLADGPDDIAVGVLRRQVDFALSPAEFSRARNEWLEFNLTVAVAEPPRRIRAAVYDYDSDRVFAATYSLPKLPR